MPGALDSLGGEVRHSWKKGLFEVGFEGGRGGPLEPSQDRVRKKIKGKEGSEDSWDQKEF